MKFFNPFKKVLIIALVVSFATSCKKEEDEKLPALNIPNEYVSADFANNVKTEKTVIDELGTLATALNQAESDANGGSTTIQAITFPSNLKGVTTSNYASKIETYLTELVKAANSSASFTIPGESGPTGVGGKYDKRLLDENGLELEQMVEKGLFGSALYNHASKLIAGNVTTKTIDQLIQIFGTDATFNADNAKYSAKYAVKRSDKAQSLGLFFEMKRDLIIAKAAIEAGSGFKAQLDKALSDFKLKWEKSNFATVINYCKGAQTKFKNATTDADKASALHSYSEAVAFTAGWLGVKDKKITDEQIKTILTKLLAPAGGTPTSYKFLKDAELLVNFNEVIKTIQEIYGFTDAEVIGFQ